MHRSITRTGCSTTLLALLMCGLSTSLASAGSKIEGILSKPVSLDHRLEKDTSLKDAMSFLSKRCGVKVVINRSEFKDQQKILNIEDVPVRLRPLPPGVHLGLIIELLSKQIEGTYKIERDHIEIVPLQKGKRNPAPDLKMSKEELDKFRKKMQKLVTLNKGIDKNTPLQDVVEFLSDRFDLAIIVDSAEFRLLAVADNVEDAPISLPPQKDVPVEKVIEQVAGQLNGDYVIKGGAVVPVPEKKAKN